MSVPFRLGLALLLAAALVSQAPAGEGAPSNPVPGLVAFASDEGLARLSRATGKADFPALANQFEAQSNIAFCGPSSAAWVWMPTATLIRGMRSFDTVENRGYILVLASRPGSGSGVMFLRGND